MITLTDNNTAVSVTLPDDIDFPSEFTRPVVHQNVTRTLSGASVVERQLQVMAEKIQLAGSLTHAVIPYSDVIKLKSMYDNIDSDLELDLNGTIIPVIFDYQNEGTPIETQAIVPCSNPTPNAKYSIKINLLTR